MSKHVTVKYSDRATGHPVEVPGDFSAEEWKTLLRFAEETDRLIQTRMISEGSSVNFKLKVGDGRVEAVATTMPPDDDLAAFLHRMRPFLLTSEPTAFFKVCKILDHRFDNATVRSIIHRQRQLFSGREFQSQIKITSNGTILNDDDIVLKWLNAYEYHRNFSLRAELNSLHQVLPLEGSRAILVSMLMDMAKAVGEIAHFIRGMERANGTQVTMKG
jgi:hypothetical protein